MHRASSELAPEPSSISDYSDQIADVDVRVERNLLLLLYDLWRIKIRVTCDLTCTRGGHNSRHPRLDVLCSTASVYLLEPSQRGTRIRIKDFVAEHVDQERAPHADPVLAAHVHNDFARKSGGAIYVNDFSLSRHIDFLYRYSRRRQALAGGAVETSHADLNNTRGLLQSNFRFHFGRIPRKQREVRRGGSTWRGNHHGSCTALVHCDCGNQPGFPHWAMQLISNSMLRRFAATAKRCNHSWPVIAATTMSVPLGLLWLRRRAGHAPKMAQPAEII